VLLLLKDAPFDKRNAQLVPAAGSCVDCPKRTGHNKLLFADKDSNCKYWHDAEGQLRHVGLTTVTPGRAVIAPQKQSASIGMHRVNRISN
jgi:hypothetical protein